MSGRAFWENSIHFHCPISSATAYVRLDFMATESTEIMAFSVTLFESKMGRPLYTANTATVTTNEHIDPTRTKSSNFHPPQSEIKGFLMLEIMICYRGYLQAGVRRGRCALKYGEAEPTVASYSWQAAHTVWAPTIARLSSCQVARMVDCGDTPAHGQSKTLPFRFSAGLRHFCQLNTPSTGEDEWSGGYKHTPANGDLQPWPVGGERSS
ncbi:hypothetical protein BJX61DRAFT_180830 [Aspergillus egyptiacus]|nr:hypothetical protein BJX61DRAFT_180830 [Aspergillus egyptiacus]